MQILRVMRSNKILEAVTGLHSQSKLSYAKACEDLQERQPLKRVLNSVTKSLHGRPEAPGAADLSLARPPRWKTGWDFQEPFAFFPDGPQLTGALAW